MYPSYNLQRGSTDIGLFIPYRAQINKPLSPNVTYFLCKVVRQSLPAPARTPVIQYKHITVQKRNCYSKIETIRPHVWPYRTTCWTSVEATKKNAFIWRAAMLQVILWPSCRSLRIPLSRTRVKSTALYLSPTAGTLGRKQRHNGSFWVLSTRAGSSDHDQITLLLTHYNIDIFTQTLQRVERGN